MECPPEFKELWRHYLKLDETRPWHPGPQAISYQEIEAYNRDMCIFLTLHERAIIRQVDKHVIPQIGKRLQKRMKNPSGQEVLPETFSVEDTGGVKGFFRSMIGAVKRKE